MAADPMAFSNAVGQELTQLLRQRAQDQLDEASDRDRLSAMLGAALISVAEVLRDPVEQGASIEGLVDLATKWLKQLLGPATGDTAG